ncbi:MAG: hypothetical protein WCI04_06460 [archaeon]
MVKVTGKIIELSKEEIELLGEDKEYELIPNQKGTFLLIDKELLKEKNEVIPKKQIAGEDDKQYVIGLIRKGSLSELVEGKFESTLNDMQKKALLELVATEKVFVFKLNETYKRGVYRLKEEGTSEENHEKKDSEEFNAPEKPLEEYNLEKDGFLIVRSKDKASQVSYQFEKQIREGHLRGIRSFDGNYYLIQTNILNNYITKTLLAMSQKTTQTNEELAQNIKVSKLLTKIICEFLKEEGELMEKKKGDYQYIK